MKKIALLSLFCVSMFNGPIKAMDMEAAAPVPALFSLGRLKLARDTFYHALDRYKRCLFTSGCTAEEFEQVKQAMSTAGKAVVVLTTAYFAYRRGLPRAKEKYKAVIAELKVTAGEISEAAVEKGMAKLDEKMEALSKEYQIKEVIRAAGDAGKKVIIDFLRTTPSLPEQPAPGGIPLLATDAQKALDKKALDEEFQKAIQETADTISNYARQQGATITDDTMKRLKALLNGLKFERVGLTGVQVIFPDAPDPQDDPLSVSSFEQSATAVGAQPGLTAGLHPAAAPPRGVVTQFDIQSSSGSSSSQPAQESTPQISSDAPIYGGAEGLD